MRLFGRRAHLRQPIHLEAQLIASRGVTPVMLTDLSVKGARLSLGRAPEPQTEVVLRWACFAAVGRVAWIDSTECGVEFDRQLDERVVATTQAASSNSLPSMPLSA